MILFMYYLRKCQNEELIAALHSYYALLTQLVTGIWQKGALASTCTDERVASAQGTHR